MATFAQVSWGFIAAVVLSMFCCSVSLYWSTVEAEAVLPRGEDVVVLLVKGDCTDNGIGGAWISLRVVLSVFLIVRGSTGGRSLSLLAIVISAYEGCSPAGSMCSVVLLVVGMVSGGGGGINVAEASPSALTRLTR